MNNLIAILSDSPHDSEKLSALKKISENLDELLRSTFYSSNIDCLVPVFMKLLNETSTQFIAENNTFQLRKLILEILLKLSSNEVMKNYSKSLQQILLSFIYSENEDNALLIIKIMTDHIKSFRPPFTVELTAFFIQWKSAYKDMFHHTSNEKMFLQHQFATTNKTIEESVTEALRTCYASTSLNYSQHQESTDIPIEKYTLIPKASQSVKVLAEMSVFLLVLIQAHRQHLFGEVMELVPIFVRFINIRIPRHIQEDKLYNKELVDEFLNSQVRALTFIAYTARQPQMSEIISGHSKAIADAIIFLFDHFHDETINQRRELLMAIKYFFQSEIRSNFISIIPKMCDDKALLGGSFTSKDQLRNQAYSLLADILHHVRMNLSPNLLLNVFFICSRNLHDQQLLPYVQTMYGKLMMNLIEPLVIHSKEAPNHQAQLEVLGNAIDSFVRKAKKIARHYLPLLIEKYRSQQPQSTNADVQHSKNTFLSRLSIEHVQTRIPSETTLDKQEEDKHLLALEASHSFWQDSHLPFTLNDCKNMVRFILQPVKMIIIALKEVNTAGNVDLLRHISSLLSDLFSYGLICLDIFTIGVNIPPGSSQIYQQKSLTNMRSKDEKETIESFIAIYTNIDPAIFENIIERHIEFFIERISLNQFLQNICNTFFAQPQTMKRIGVVLVKFLLRRLSDLGSSNERATLHLKLFKLIFQAVSCSQNNSDSDAILKPFLHQIVKESMNLALTSRESTNYFLLLRALFRSIGSGTYDHLYQQFLPLLPSILQQLNRLQNGSHRQPIHELFVELCLTVPVRLSSLLPYLPLLMDPLVCALNGSPTLVQQGLRTLELCVDNLQPEYFYDHMLPVRAALMKGLWHTVSLGDTQSALNALRILGKFGGSNRKVLLDAQTMDFDLHQSSNCPHMCFIFEMGEQETHNQIQQMSLEEKSHSSEQRILNCAFPLEELVQSAVAILKSQASDVNGQQFGHNFKVPASEFIKAVLVSIIRLDMVKHEAKNVFAKCLHNLKRRKHFSNYISSTHCSRKTFIKALNGLFIAVYNVETRTQTLQFFKALIKHLTIQAILESCKEYFDPIHGKDTFCLDSLILIDAIIDTLSDSCKDFCHTAVLALRLMLETASSLFEGDKEQACQLPIFSLLIERIVALCYRREWFAKLGGCTALRLIIEHYPKTFVQQNLENFLNACIEIISGLSNELSSGALDFASKTIDSLLNICFSFEQPEQYKLLDKKLLISLISRLIDHIDDSDNTLRNECKRVIHSLANHLGLSMGELLALCADTLHSKILNGLKEFALLPLTTKIAVIDMYIFCTSIEDLVVEIPFEFLEMFSQNLLCICRSRDKQLFDMFNLSQSNLNLNDQTSKENVQNMGDEHRDQFKYMRAISTKALIRLFSFHNGDDKSEMRNPQILMDIFHHLVDTSLESNDTSQQGEALIEIKKIVQMGKIETRSYINEKLKQILDEFENKSQFISKDFFKKMKILTTYTQEISNDAVQKIINDLSMVMQTTAPKSNIADIECVIGGFELFNNLKYYHDGMSKMMLKFLSKYIFNFQKNKQQLWLHPILEYMSHFPSNFIQLFLDQESIASEEYSRFILMLISDEGAHLLRSELLGDRTSIKIILAGLPSIGCGQQKIDLKVELRILKFITALLDDQLDLANHQSTLEEIFAFIYTLWTDERFRERYSVRKILPNIEHSDEHRPEVLDECKFDIPSCCARILLTKLRFLMNCTNADDSHIESIDLLYHLTFAFVHTYASDFTFLQKFIDEEIIPKCSLEWGRAAFFKIISLLKSDPKSGHSVNLVKFMQYVVAPVFAYAFEVHEVDQVVGSSATSETEQQDDQNIVSVLCREIIQRLTNDRTVASDSFTIMLYLFCSVLVQKCPMHIYDPSKKQQGSRQEQGNLRHFMLFGWPCLQQSFQGDITEKYAGHFLIANIIDKFSINRTIILQVLNSLLQAHHQDNKEMVKKSIDILIPALPRRMTDGYSQLEILTNKIMTEENRNNSQLIHCLQIIVRHYKVFYNIRHKIALLILASLQRLFSIQFNFETRRLMLEVCDVFIKWEQERHALISEESAQDPSEPLSTINGSANQDLHRQMDAQFIDSAILLLFKIATSTEQLGSAITVSSSMEQINKRAIILLRAALKPNVFGNIFSVNTQLLEKQLQLPNTEQFSAGNEQAIGHQIQLVNMTLDVLTNIINHIPPKLLLDIFQPLQRALISCITYVNSQQILRSTCNILSKLLEKSKCSSTGLDEFEVLNQHIARCIHDAFNNYASILSCSPPMTIITLLRLMHSSQPSYLETVCLGPFLKLMQRLVRDYVVCTHGSSSTDQAQKLVSDLLSICLEVLYSRTKYFTVETQRTIIQLILVPLVEKNAIDKIMEIIIKISHEIVNTEISLLDEKHLSENPPKSQGAHLLIKIFISMEHRIVINSDLQRQFLNSILYLYENKDNLDVNLMKLQPAFYWGLSSNVSEIRHRFFVVFEKHFPKDIVNRILHILSKENWSMMGTYFWVDHIVHLLLLARHRPSGLLLLNSATLHQTLNQIILNISRNATFDEPDSAELMDIGATEGIESGTNREEMELRENEGIETTVKSKQISFVEYMEPIFTEFKSSVLISDEKLINLIEILHNDSVLCTRIFVELFSSIWSELTSSEREQITNLASPFLISSTLSIQQESTNSVVKCFLEAFLHCSPSIKLDPFILSYVGSTHKCWHLALITLEQYSKGIKLTGDQSLLNEHNPHMDNLELLDCLANVYEQLNENDQFYAVWKKRAYFEKTVKCLAFYNQNEFVRAREIAEKLISQLNERLTKALPSDSMNGLSSAIRMESQVWEQCWINSCKQLNDWSVLENFANSEEVSDASLLMESAWHQNDWKLLKDCLIQVDFEADPKTSFKSSLYKIMMNISNFDKQEHNLNKELIEKSLLDLNKALILDWKKLPSLVTHSHTNILNNTHILHEVYESANVLCTNLPSVNFPHNNGAASLNNAVKHIMKSWRSRPITSVDSLSSWIDLFTWRYKFFHSILRFYENTDQKSALQLPIHALAQSHLQLARCLRHSNQNEMALNELNKLHAAMLVHPVDLNQKLDEHIKCLLKLSTNNDHSHSNNSKKITSQDALIEALDIIEGAQLHFIRKDQVARLMVHKGLCLSRLDKRDEANRTFSTAAQLEQVDLFSAPSAVWKHWGEFLTNIFLSNHIESSVLSTGMQAIACTLEYAKTSTPQKSRAAIAKLLWLIKIASASSFEKAKHCIDELIFKYIDLIPPANWIFWLNEIIADVRQRQGSAMTEILKRLGRAYPQDVFCALRVEISPNIIADNMRKILKSKQCLSHPSSDVEMEEMESQDLSPFDKIIKVFNFICAHNFTDINILNTILSELDNLPIGHIEKTLNEMRQILFHCHFDQFTKIAELTSTNTDSQILHRLNATINSCVEFVTCLQEGPQRLVTEELIADFKRLLYTNTCQQIPLHKVASLLRKWIPRLCECLSREYKRHQSMRDSSKFLSNFKCSMAQISVFDGNLDPDNSKCNSHISQFLSLFEVHFRSDSVYRLIRIRSQNGKIYSYQLERVRYDHSKGHIFKLFTLLNAEFSKIMNTSQRLVQFAIPQILFTGENSRLIGCCPLAGISSQYQNANSDHSSENFVVFTDILNEMVLKNKGGRHLSSSLAIVEYYYNRLAEQRYSHKSIHELYNSIVSTRQNGSTPNKSHSSSSSGIVSVPRDCLSKWMRSRYSDPSSFWIARKKLAIHFALLGLSEHVFFLSSMTLDGLILDLSTAHLFFTEYKFDLTKKVCETMAGKVRFIELDANRPVPFRLTSNISYFLDASIDGHFNGTLVSVSRSLKTRFMEVWLRPILWDIISKAAEEDPQMNIVNPVKRAIDTVLNRIKLISHFEAGVSATTQLQMQAQLPDNLCRMDPSWHPWF